MLSLYRFEGGFSLMNGLKRAQDYLRANAYDGMLLISPTNLRYFTGFTGTTAVALLLKDNAFIVTDGRYTEQAKKQCENVEVIQYTETVWLTIQDILQRNAITLKKCVFEGNYVPYDTCMKIHDALPEVEFISVDLAELRAVKREDELVIMRKAAQIADEAYAAMLPQLRVGMTEREAKIILEVEMLKRGSTEPSFSTIVASGHRSSLPHGRASDKVIEAGDFVTFDFGAVYEGYHSDMTRTIVMGTASELQKKLYDIVLKAQVKGVEAVKAGMSGKAIDAVCRDSITADGYGQYFDHGTGHGVGLDIHELPVASKTSSSTLEENMIVTVEPGVYLPGEMGLRIEDSVIVTKDGCEIITKTSKDLLELK